MSEKRYYLYWEGNPKAYAFAGGGIFPDWSDLVVYQPPPPTAYTEKQCLNIWGAGFTKRITLVLAKAEGRMI